MANREITFPLYHIALLLSELYNSRMSRSLIDVFQEFRQRFFVALCFSFNLPPHKVNTNMRTFQTTK